MGTATARSSIRMRHGSPVADRLMPGATTCAGRASSPAPDTKRPAAAVIGPDAEIDLARVLD
jgi:hypothetical protein